MDVQRDHGRSGSSTGQRGLKCDGECVEHDHRSKHPRVALRLELGHQEEREHRRSDEGENGREREEPVNRRAVTLRTAQDEWRTLIRW